MYNTIIVEDDPMVMEINRGYIENCKDIKITETFSNGKKAFEYISKGNPVDLVILDINMPEMNGFEFLDKLRSSGNRCAVIPVTAANEPDSVKTIYNHTVVDYLVKPFDQKRLELAINRFLKYQEVAEKNEPITQDELNKLFGIQSGLQQSSEINNKHEKKIEQSTLDYITKFLAEHSGEMLTAKIISDNLGISLVTIRRYMDHLIKNGTVRRITDYKTKGRPAAVYIYR